MSEPYIGEIIMFAGNFAPRGWAFCNGQILSIAQNTALFSILGTTYGGNGQTTFALPNLQGRVPMHWGAGPGLTPRDLGETSGTETVTLISSQMPAHNHIVNANTAAGTGTEPTNSFIAGVADANSGGLFPAFESTANTTLNPMAVGVAGGSQPHANMQPYQCVSFIIALQGVFPSRN
jgi:microcystin-dependent protein